MAKLFYDDEFDALQQMVAASDRTPKEVACFLRPDLKPASAYAWFQACLSPHGDQRLKFGQIIAAMKFCERFDPLMYMADEVSHERPRPVTKEDELTGLLRRYLEIAGEKDKLGERIEKVRRVV